ncbi:DUF1707 SHOCT-like domain-containing protein [Actinomadura rupiterrae]|uniref:DUF1707 SHOCT-like domain-containing protein n=1 Tax=Actinomadura rupiterrae TaxID=559627 RepID=UPI0020A3ECEB|nr:DUF1707 domain-containing protein [Actinomadura rupiterrae]MCP2336401.1 hypothetical protein [Actinomadura rupiterrae]
MTNLPEKPDLARPPEMRASDADRDRVASILRDAAGEGRLTLDEVDERLDAVYKAKTYAELEPLTRDLPAAGDAPSGPAPAARAGAGGFVVVPGETPTWTNGIAIMSGFDRKGVWTVPETFTAFAFWGGGDIDLREARFTSRTTRINAVAIMGGIDIIVPDDVNVRVTGIGIMGGFDHRATGPGIPGAPEIVISGLAFWGGVDVKRRPRRRAVER